MAGETDILKKDLEELRAALNRITEDLKTIREAQTEELTDYARRQARKAREGIRDAAEEVTARTKQSAETFENVVRENPLRSLLAAFGLGLVIAQLLRHR